MDIAKWSSLGSRLFFGAALILFAVAVLQWVFAHVGMTFRSGYDPGRLVEFAAMFLIPVVTVLLRQIRDELRSQHHS